MAPVDFDYDPNEIVFWPGKGKKRLRTFVREIMRWPAKRRHLVYLYRARGKVPAMFDITHIEMLAKEPVIAGSSDDD
jgi:hypothetical protein